MSTLDKEQEIRVVQISEGGSKINLDDGSKWKTAPYFKQEVFDHWRHGDRVVIREVSDDPGYPWTIFNREENLEVAARRIN
jgi:hypothetical protein